MSRLNCGCGRRPLEGYLNVDLERYEGVDYALFQFLRWDLRGGLPAGRWVEIRAEQFLEHLNWREGRVFLQRCREALAPGGVLRLTVPCLDTHLEAIRRGEALVPLPYWLSLELAQWPYQPEENALLFVLYSEGHQCAYTEGILRQALQRAGFAGFSIERIDHGANLSVQAPA